MAASPRGTRCVPAWTPRAHHGFACTPKNVGKSGNGTPAGCRCHLFHTWPRWSRLVCQHMALTRRVMWVPLLTLAPLPCPCVQVVVFGGGEVGRGGGGVDPGSLAVQVASPRVVGYHGCEVGPRVAVGQVWGHTRVVPRARGPFCARGVSGTRVCGVQCGPRRLDDAMGAAMLDDWTRV